MRRLRQFPGAFVFTTALLAALLCGALFQWHLPPPCPDGTAHSGTAGPADTRSEQPAGQDGPTAMGRQLLLRSLFSFPALVAGLLFLGAGLAIRDPFRFWFGLQCVSLAGSVGLFLLESFQLLRSPLCRRLEVICYYLFFLAVYYGTIHPLLASRRLCPWMAVCTAGMCLLETWGAHPGSPVRLWHLLLPQCYRLMLLVLFWAALAHPLRNRAAIPRLWLCGACVFSAALLLELALPRPVPAHGWRFFQLGGIGFTIATAVHLFCKEVRQAGERMALRQQLDRQDRLLKTAERQLELQKARIHSLQKAIAHTRRSRHDLRHHVALLHQLLDTDPQRARRYLARWGDFLPASQAPLCRNIAADCILRHYASAAREAGARVEVAVDMPELPGIADWDLCIVLGNLLENAVEALGTDPGPSPRLLRVTAGVTAKMLTINVDNTCQGPLSYRHGILLSAKRDGGGIGMDRIRAVAERYHGKFWWRVESGVFRASVVLKAERQGMTDEDCSV